MLLEKYGAYTTVVRPIIIYTAMVGWPRVNTKRTDPTSQTVAIKNSSYGGMVALDVFWRPVTTFGSRQ